MTFERYEIVAQRSSTPLACHVLNVDHRAFAKHAPNVFRSLRCFLDKSTCSDIDVVLVSKKMLATLRPKCFLRPPHLHCEHQHVPSVARFAAEFCDIIPNALCQTGNSNFHTTTPLFLATYFRFAFLFQKKSLTSRCRQRALFCFFLRLFCAFIVFCSFFQLCFLIFGIFL